MTVIVALVLSLMSTGLKDVHKKNEAVYNKRAIISAVKNQLEKPLEAMSDEEVAQIFENNIDQKALNAQGQAISEEEIVASGYPTGKAEEIDLGAERKKPVDQRIYPLFIFDKGGEKYYITSVRGNGLWDEIWGNIALEGDFKTIAGVAFDHKAETPGLGAEIKDNDAFKKQFVGKSILDEANNFVGINLIKGGAPNDAPHAVDGITGATVTANGVEKMIENGFDPYNEYFSELQ
jgi:Na+-transporting NADH:ubiquinone oxidoreductase subunit C